MAASLTGVAVLAAAWFGRHVVLAGSPGAVAASVALLGLLACLGLLLRRLAGERAGLVRMGADIERLAAGRLELEGRMREAEQAARERESALRARAELLDRALAGVSETVLTTDPDCRVTYMNRAAERLTGWGADEATGRDLREVVGLDPATAALLEKALERSEREEGAVSLAEWPVCLWRTVGHGGRNSRSRGGDASRGWRARRLLPRLSGSPWLCAAECRKGGRRCVSCGDRREPAHRRALASSGRSACVRQSARMRNARRFARGGGHSAVRVPFPPR